MIDGYAGYTAAPDRYAIPFENPSEGWQWIFKASNQGLPIAMLQVAWKLSLPKCDGRFDLGEASRLVANATGGKATTDYERWLANDVRRNIAKYERELLSSTSDMYVRHGVPTNIAIPDDPGAVNIRFNGDLSEIRLQMRGIRNSSQWQSGSIAVVFWLCSTPYNGGRMDGEPYSRAILAASLGAGKVKMRCMDTLKRKGNPPTGQYQVAMTINEHNADGNWYIVNWCTFTDSVRFAKKTGLLASFVTDFNNGLYDFDKYREVFKG